MQEIHTISLKPISTLKDLEFIFEMLKERDAEININFVMPNFENHLKFANSHPYSAWDIIWLGIQRIGHIYLTKKNEMGIFLMKGYRSKGYGSRAVNQFMFQNPRDAYLANISTKNIDSMKFFDKIGFKSKYIVWQFNRI